MKWDWKMSYEFARNITTEHPYAICGTAIGSIVAFGPGMVAGSALNAAGFTAGGVSAGSCAAWIQSHIAPVAAKSVFAYCQSAAAGGYAAPLLNGATQGAGAALAAGSAYWADWIYGGQPPSSDKMDEAPDYVVINQTPDDVEN